MTVTGIILAGGASARFRTGSAGPSKLDARLGARTVLEATTEALRAVVDEIIVVGRPAPTPPAGPVAAEVVRYVADVEPLAGPLRGLLTGLEAARDVSQVVVDGDLVLAVGGDMPLLRAAVLRLLLERLGRPPRVAAAVLALGAGWQPLPLALRLEPALSAAAAALAAGDRSLRGLVQRLAHDAVGEAEWRVLDPDADTLLDIDTPADLELARGQWARG